MPAGRYRNPSREATPMNIRTVLLVRVPTLCAEVGLGCGGDDRAASTAPTWPEGQAVPEEHSWDGWVGKARTLNQSKSSE